MAISESIGYDGNLDEEQVARWSRYWGADYDVGGEHDWEVSVVAGLDRTVQVAAGEGFGKGVLDVNDAGVDVQLPVVASGARWDLVVARRDWQPTGGQTTFGFVQGTAVQQIPAGRESTRGVVDEQPLALVRVEAGQTAPTAVLDLRARSRKIVTAGSLLAVPDPREGDRAAVGGVDYVYGPNSVGNLAWLPDSSRPFAQAQGRRGFSGTVDRPPGGAAGPYAAQYPAGRFTVPPRVYASIEGLPAGAQYFRALVTGVTASGFTFYVYNTYHQTASIDGPFAVVWHAVQMTSTAADG